MTPAPLPQGTPTTAQMTSRLETAQRQLEDLQTVVDASVATATMHAQSLMTGNHPPEALLRALRTIRAATLAMLEPAEEVFTQLLALQTWAEGASWEALGVPLAATEPTPADIADRVEEWLGSHQGGY